jgi:hypothetical protein
LITSFFIFIWGTWMKNLIKQVAWVSIWCAFDAVYCHLANTLQPYTNGPRQFLDICLDSHKIQIQGAFVFSNVEPSTYIHFLLEIHPNINKMEGFWCQEKNIHKYSPKIYSSNSTQEQLLLSIPRKKYRFVLKVFNQDTFPCEIYCSELEYPYEQLCVRGQPVTYINLVNKFPGFGHDLEFHVVHLI